MNGWSLSSGQQSILVRLLFPVCIAQHEPVTVLVRGSADTTPLMHLCQTVGYLSSNILSLDLQPGTRV